MASTETMTYQDSLDSQYLSSSFSNLSRSRSSNSLIVRTYKQATQMYLTKRFKEALETLEPIVAPPQTSHGEVNGTEARANGDANRDGANSHASPIAQATKGTKTKVLVFYLSLLNAIIDLGAEAGKLQFGSTKWRQLASTVRGGAIWEEIVQCGYGGNEADVDADVVVNLATLLLAHMPTQKLNQQRLETWLSASNSADSGSHVQLADGTMSPLPNGMTTPSSSPKAFATRLKILELYTLHVLPANEEWTYAKEFIELNDSLDEERKEAFLNALQQLRDKKDGTAQRERELTEQREREMEEQRRVEEARQLEESRRREAEQQRTKAAEAELRKAIPSQTAPPKASKNLAKPATNGHTAKPTSRPAPRAQNKPPPSPPPSPSSNMYRRASSVLNNLQRMIMQASRQMTGGNPMVTFRFLMFMLAFVMIIARQDLRLKIKRIVEDGWLKVKKTVGMGVKVSYI